MDILLSSPEFQFETNPLYADLTPIAQDDGPTPFVVIDYTPKYKTCAGYYRAIVSRNELSERALNILTAVLCYDPTNYTAWAYRRKIILALEKDLNEELDFSTNILVDHPKVYQAWHHRVWILTNLRNFSTERDLVSALLDDDIKNYHAWQHFQWVLSECGWSEKDFLFAQQFIEKDPANNSLWNFRYRAITELRGWNPHIVRNEMKYALEYIFKCPQNESAWNYLLGVIPLGKYHKYIEMLDVVRLLKRDKNSNYLRHAYDYIATFLYYLISEDQQAFAIHLPEFHKCCDLLIAKLDVVRRGYWQYLKLTVNDP